MEPIRDDTDSSRQLRVRDLLTKLVNEKKEQEKKVDTKKNTKTWKWPGVFKKRMAQGSKQREKVVVFYLTIRGDIEPMVLPLYGGNMVIVGNKVHEVDPRAFWITKIGFKTYKILILKQIDRRPVSNLDYSEIKKRGDATDSDEILIKATLLANAQKTASPPINKTLIVIGILIVLGIVGYMFFSA